MSERVIESSEEKPCSGGKLRRWVCRKCEKSHQGQLLWCETCHNRGR